MANTHDFVVKNGLQVNDDSTVAGDISLGDNNKLKFGASDDLQIYHSGTWSLIDDTGTGGLSLRSNDIRLEKYTGETLARFAADNAVFLYYDNSLKFQTTTTGIDVTGTAEIDTLSIGGTTVSATPTELNLLDGATVTTTEINYNDITTLGTVQTSKTVTANSSGNVNFPDGYKAQFGDGSDLQIYHDGSNSFIKDAGTGYLVIQANSIGFANAANNENLAFFTQDGAATLYYDNAAKIATTSTGIDVTGNITVSGTVDGRDLATDGTKLDGIESGATADQTITAGSGLTGGGTGDVTLYHADTSSQASVDNSNGTVIQDVTLDGYGHVTALGSVNLDGRYYTETEADARYLRKNTSDVHTFNTTTGEALKFANNTSGGQIQVGFQQNDTDGMHHRGYIRSRKSSAGNAAGIIEILPRQSGGGTGTAFTLEAGQDPKWGGNKVWHAGNDGSGSGLDADTVDGIQGASFLRSDADDTGTGTYTFSPGGATGNTYFGSSTQTSYMNLIIRSNSGNAQIWKSGTGYSGYGGTSSLNIYNSNSNISFFSNGRTSYDMQISAGNVDVAGSITAAGGDGGARMGAWAYDSSYAMFGTANMTSQEYALLTDGTSTYLSGGSGGSVSIRGGNNDSDPQIEVTNDIIRIRKITSSEPDNVYFQFLDSGTEVGVIGTGYSDELYIASSGKSGIRFTASSVAFGNDTGTIVNNTYDLGQNSYRIRSGYFGTDVRAPIFYDIDDTAYYVNPASTSNLSGLNVASNAINGRQFRQAVNATVSAAGWYRVASNTSVNGRGDFSVHVSTTGGSYTPRSLFIKGRFDWSTLGVLYEVNSPQGGYWNAVRITDDGSGGAHVEVYFTQSITSAQLAIWTESIGHDTFYPNSGTLAAGGGTVRDSMSIVGRTNFVGTTYNTADFRAPIFYDSNDTAYYANPASTSNFYHLNLGNWNASSYIPLNIKANTNNTGILVGRSNNYTTTFSVLPWGSGRTYLSSGTHYENGTWTIQSDGGSAALFAFAGADGAKWWAGTGGSSYSNVASEVQLWENSGRWRNNVTASTDVRAPIFYDTDNTSYYVDPAGASILQGLKLDDSVNNSSGTDAVLWIYRDNNNDWGQIIDADQVSATDYGLRIDCAASHNYGLLVRGGGSEMFKVNSDYAWHHSDMRSPIFYDSANTAYYVDPASTSSMWNVNIRGDLNSTSTYNQIFFWGSGSTTTSAIGFKSNGGDFTNPTGNGDGYNTYLTMDTAGRGWVFRRGTGGTDFSAAYTSGWILNNGLWQSNGSMRAPIFYDSNNTSYYVNPASGFYQYVGTYTGTFVTTDSSGGISIEGSSTGGPKLGLKSTATGGEDLWLISNNSGNAGGAGKLQFWNNSGGFTFAVFGTANTSDTTYIYCNLTASGNVTAYSDERLKENVVVIPDALDKVKAIRGVTFNRKDMEGNPRHAGVIAQEVEKVLPEVVSEDNEGTKTVAYGNMVGLLIEAIKELKDEVDDLKAQLAAK